MCDFLCAENHTIMAIESLVILLLGINKELFAQAEPKFISF